MEQASQHFLAGKKIAVAGAGIAGLAFVAGLRKQWDSSLKPPMITIYDRDTREGSLGREGYSLSLAGQDKDGGLYALLQLGLLDEILGAAILGTEGTGSFKLWNPDFSEILSVRGTPAPGLPTAGIRIARKDLRRILLQAASETADVRWATSCVSAQQNLDGHAGGGRIKVRILDHASSRESEEEVDLLVAADGADSKLRASLRPDDGLEFAGAVQMGGLARILPSPVDVNWGAVITGTGTFCFFSPVDKHNVVWALSRTVPCEQPRLDKTDEDAVKAMLDECLEFGKTIRQPFAALVAATDPSTTFVLNARDKKPFAHDLSLGSIVFIGDSNHAVSPFSGFGANLALKDGWELSEKLCQSTSLRAAVGAYDAVRIPKALKVLKTSHQRIRMGHSTGLLYWMYRIGFGAIGLLLRVLGK